MNEYALVLIAFFHISISNFYRYSTHVLGVIFAPGADAVDSATEAPDSDRESCEIGQLI